VRVRRCGNPAAERRQQTQQACGRTKAAGAQAAAAYNADRESRQATAAAGSRCPVVI